MEITLDLTLKGSIVLFQQAPGGGEPTLEANVWPQPDFDASDGLTLTNAAISGGELVFFAEENGSQICAMTTPPTFTEGEVWHYSVEVITPPPGTGLVMLQIGGQSVDMRGATPIGLQTGTVTIGASPTQAARFYEGSGFVGFAANSCTIQREA